MIHALDNRHAPLGLRTDMAVVPLSARMDDASDGGASLIEEMTRHIAVQQFVEALMQGEPELTGVPAVSLDGEY
jgi:hypothetical protein